MVTSAIKAQLISELTSLKRIPCTGAGALKTRRNRYPLRVQ